MLWSVLFLEDVMRIIALILSATLCSCGGQYGRRTPNKPRAEMTQEERDRCYNETPAWIYYAVLGTAAVGGGLAARGKLSEPPDNAQFFLGTGLMAAALGALVIVHTPCRNPKTGRRR